LPGYRIRYSAKKGTFALQILLQVPKILSAMGRERRWLKDFTKRESFDVIISDNRYGFYAKGIRSVILTHQLQIISGMGQWVDQLLKKWHYGLLERFDACWVVDCQNSWNLAGKLSHPDSLPGNARFIGLLSQFGSNQAKVKAVGGQVLLLLSGPEPMRSLLEMKLLSQIVSLSQYQFVVVAGAVSGATPESMPAHVRYHPWLNATELGRMIQESELVICRSGYSTLMDISVLHKRALLVPTPGQTEQEYLAGLLQDRGICLARRQDQVNLEKDIDEALKMPGFSLSDTCDSPQSLREAVNQIEGAATLSD
jgi:UDP-N-acetylglucosamine transferase subunit ALG13